MVVQPRLSDRELFFLTVADDTEEAPWMVMPDFQWRVVALLMSILRLHVARSGLRWYLAADLKVSMPRAITTRVRTRRVLDVAPDLLMAEADDTERASWQVISEGQPPLFVLEVVTEASVERDLEEKPEIYDAMGVREYAIFAPRRTDGGAALLGYQRDTRGRFVPWSADAQGVLWSAALGGLGLYVEDGKWLRARDSAGRRLPSAEEEAARAEQEAARAEQEAAARRAAEAEVARLRALLHLADETSTSL